MSNDDDFPDDDDEDLLPEYDFRGAVRGKFYASEKAPLRVIIDPDVARHFRSVDEVHAALRQLIAEGRTPEPRNQSVTLRITWDPVKAAENRKKHGISFNEAREIFNDPLRATEDDDDHDEDRYRSFGSTAAGKVLFVCYTLQENEVRLISARLATRSEKRSYMDDEQTIYDRPMEPDDEDAANFDWSSAVRGLHYIPREKGSVTLDEDVYGIFRTSEEVNDALRMLIREGRIPHFLSDDEWNAKHQKVTAESPSPPARPARRGGVRRR